MIIFGDTEKSRQLFCPSRSIGGILISVSRPDTRALVDRLAQYGVKTTEDVKHTAHNPNIAGKTFVVTGTLENYKRSQIEELIRSLGGTVSGSVSKNTNVLIAGHSAGSKLKKAQDLGVLVLNEDEFMQWVG